MQGHADRIAGTPELPPTSDSHCRGAGGSRVCLSARSMRRLRTKALLHALMGQPDPAACPAQGGWPTTARMEQSSLPLACGPLPTPPRAHLDLEALAAAIERRAEELAGGGERGGGEVGPAVLGDGAVAARALGAAGGGGKRVSTPTHWGRMGRSKGQGAGGAPESRPAVSRR